MSDYRSYADLIKRTRKLGQNFLIDNGVAKLEASYAKRKHVIELGAGLGILTEELCKVAKSVIAVEIDAQIYQALQHRIHADNLTLINKDFFALDKRVFENADMLASNMPYALSSKILMWLAAQGLDAVLCMQREFMLRMTARHGSSEYSRLSVICSLSFEMRHIANVPASAFYPRPRVSSAVMFVKPKDGAPTSDERSAISMLMSHKNKKLSNAVIDSASHLMLSKQAARQIANKMSYREDRPSQMSATQILEAARELMVLQNEYAGG